jgi:hypothetical protein
MTPRRITIGENIHRYHSSEKRPTPMSVKYFPMIEVSVVERNIRTQSVMRIPPASIFWSSTVMNDVC